MPTIRHNRSNFPSAFGFSGATELWLVRVVGVVFVVVVVVTVIY